MTVPKKKKTSKLDIFETHGVALTGESGDQVIGTCPFTGKDGKFYINKNTFLWDSKTGGVSGNINEFLRLTAIRYQKLLTPELLQKLADARGLPTSAFTGWGLGWTGRAYAIPVCDVRGRTVDIRTYRIGGSVYATKGANTGLLWSEQLAKNPSWPVYVCEGEWDAIALRWLLLHLKKEGVVVAVPGSGTFKSEWVPWIAGRRVHTLFDHDAAGEAAEHRMLGLLKNSVQLLTFVHWPESFPSGFDVRDWVIAGAIRKLTPKRCFRALTEMFRLEPRQTVLPETSANAPDDANGAERGPESVIERRETKWKHPPTLDEVYTEFKKWLYLDSTDGIAIMLATVISQQIDGEPVWMFIVGPPGSAKTETLSSLSWVENMYMTSSVTPHSLISGASWKDGGDPSLIPKLDGKVMVIKDFTSILSMRDTEKDEVFGILRDAYDGKCGKEFGNGIVRRYESRFTVLAAVTPSIYALSSSHTALGERFLKFGIGDNLVHQHEDEIIERAISNINRETAMRDDLADVVHAFLSRRLRMAKIEPKELPVIPDGLRKRVIALARFGSRMRGTVTRDTFRNDIITSRPSAEVGSRLGKQLAKLCQALAVVRGRRTVSAEDYRLVKKVMLDTIPQRTEDLIRHMLLHCPRENDTMTAGEIAIKTRYPQATVSRILQDLTVLDITRRVAVKIGVHGNGTCWTLTPYIRKVIADANLYSDKEDTERTVGSMSVRVIRRRAKRPPAA